MKRILIAGFMGAVAVTASAQVPADLTVKIPDWKQVAFSHAEDARVYKTASSAAPFCVYNPKSFDGEGSPTKVAYWGKAAKGLRELRFSGSTPVVGKTAGWLNLYRVGPKHSDGWVMANVVNVADKVDITSQLIAEEPGLKDFYGLTVFMLYHADEQTADIFFGRLDNGMLGFPYAVESVTFSDSEDGKCSLGENDDYVYINLTPAQKGLGGAPVMKQIPDDVIAQLADMAQPVKRPLVFVLTTSGVATTNL